jgi:hypothetical protein
VRAADRLEAQLGHALRLVRVAHLQRRYTHTPTAMSAPSSSGHDGWSYCAQDRRRRAASPWAGCCAQSSPCIRGRARRPATGGPPVRARPPARACCPQSAPHTRVSSSERRRPQECTHRRLAAVLRQSLDDAVCARQVLERLRNAT